MSDTQNTQHEVKRGAIFAVLAYFGWGFFPIYWKFLKHIPSIEILCHRVIWSFIFYGAILFYQNKKPLLYIPRNIKLARNLAIAALLLMANWFVYIYAVNSNQIVESSLGYFINPLVNILLGVVLLKEKLSKSQKIATGLAALGVLIITYDQGRIPWIAFFLASTFALYGYLKKTNPVNTVLSNQFESMLFFPVALAYLFIQPHGWQNETNTVSSYMLLVGSGIITGLPLLFFSAAAQRIPYYLMGFFQFIAPSLQFMSGVMLFGEPVSLLKLKGFMLIWAAGLLLIATGWINRKV